MLRHLLGDTYWDEAEEVIYSMIKTTGLTEFVVVSDLTDIDSHQKVLNDSLQVVAQYLIHLYGYVLKNSFKGEIQDEIERIKINENFTKIHCRNSIVIKLEDFAPHFKNNPEIMKDLCIQFLVDCGIKKNSLISEKNVQNLWDLVLQQKADHYDY